MTAYSVPTFISSIVGTILGGLVFIKDPRKLANILFFILCVSISIWYLSVAVMLSSKNESLFFLFAKIGLSPILFIIIPYVLFAFNMFDIKNIKLIILLSIVNLICLYFLLDNNSTFTLFFSGKHIYPWGPYPKAGIFETVNAIALILGIVLCIIACEKKNKQIKKSISKIESVRLRYILIALLIFALCSIDYLPKFGVGIYPSGCIFFLIFASTITYAILKHNLLDIKFVVKKGLIYSLLITAITAIYFGLILVLEYIFRGFVGYKSVPLTLGMIAIFIVILQPLKNKIQFVVDKYFFKGSIEQIEHENILLREELQQSEKLKTVGTLAAGMAHEIKNPLTSIKIFTEYLSEKHNDKAFIQKFQNIVGSEVLKINNIVSQLLDFAKPKPLELSRCGIGSLVDETLELLSNDFIKYRICLIKNYKEPDLILTIDPVQIKQVVLNITLNSIDAMKNTGGNLKISTAAEKSNDFAILEIEDTGYGIESKNMNSIFDPFFTTKDTNTGLGLSIVHGIVEKHKGRIEVSSQIGSGTKFIIHLPI